MSDIYYNWEVFKENLVNEIGENLALPFTISLISKSKGDIKKASKIYYDLGKLWSSTIIHFKNWVIENAYYKPKLIMRDAKPLTVISESKEWEQVWLNRENCGIDDELSNSTSKTSCLLEEYLEQNNLLHCFTFVDTGCWGSIVKDLHTKLNLKFQPLFFYSHNPNIQGFLNELSVDEKKAEALNDSLECCFINIVQRSDGFYKDNNGKIKPIIKPMDNFSITLGKAVMQGIKEGELYYNKNNNLPSLEENIDILVGKSEKAKSGEFTGILPYNSPTWSKGNEFINSWPTDLNWKIKQHLKQKVI